MAPIVVIHQPGEDPNSAYADLRCVSLEDWIIAREHRYRALSVTTSAIPSSTAYLENRRKPGIFLLTSDAASRFGVKTDRFESGLLAPAAIDGSGSPSCTSAIRPLRRSSWNHGSVDRWNGFELFEPSAVRLCVIGCVCVRVRRGTVPRQSLPRGF
jgi:hypothetical protein